MASSHPDHHWRCVLFLSLAALGCAADLLTKSWVFQWRGMPTPNNEWWIWEGVLGIETAINTGALFGMGQGQVFFFATVSFLAIGGILYWVFLGHVTRDLLVTVALGLILGGILGNLYDWLGFWGQYGVRDWILIRYRSFTWPNFNIADSLLVVGAGILMWHAYREGRPAAEPSGSDVSVKAESSAN